MRCLSSLTRIAACLATLGALLTGCGPKAVQSGLLSDYTRLAAVDDHRMRYIGPSMSSYRSFIVDPVQIRIDAGVLKPNERAEIANYMHGAFTKLLKDRGYAIAQQPGVGVARVRLAISGVQKSTWWMNVHLGSKLTGAGTGGASMEGEVVDSVTGEQIAAVVQAGKGSQFELDTFNAIDDVKDVIDKWAATAGDRLDELQRGANAAR